MSTGSSNLDFKDPLRSDRIPDATVALRNGENPLLRITNMKGNLEWEPNDGNYFIQQPNSMRSRVDPLVQEYLKNSDVMSGRIIIRSIYLNRSELLRSVAPLNMSQSSLLTFTTTTHHLVITPATDAPEYTIGDTNSNYVRSQQHTLSRYQKSAQMSKTGLSATDNAQFMWEQYFGCAHSFDIGIALQVESSILMQESSYINRLYMANRSALIPFREMQRILRNNWGFINQRKNVDALVSETQRVSKMFGADTIDTVLLPDIISPFLNYDADLIVLSQFNSKPAEFKNRLRVISLPMDTLEIKDQYNSYDTFETRGQMGGFFSTPHYEDLDIDTYSTRALDVMVYDETSDDYRVIPVGTLLKNCYLFDAASGEPVSLVRNNSVNADIISGYSRADLESMPFFAFDSNAHGQTIPDPIKFNVEIHPDSFTENDVVNMSKTALRQIFKSRVDTEAAFNSMFATLRSLADESATNGAKAMAVIARALAIAVQPDLANVVPRGILHRNAVDAYTSTGGCVRLPTDREIHGAFKVLFRELVADLQNGADRQDNALADDAAIDGLVNAAFPDNGTRAIFTAALNNAAYGDWGNEPIAGKTRRQHAESFYDLADPTKLLGLPVGFVSANGLRELARVYSLMSNPAHEYTWLESKRDKMQFVSDFYAKFDSLCHNIRGIFPQSVLTDPAVNPAWLAYPSIATSILSNSVFADMVPLGLFKDNAAVDVDAERQRVGMGAVDNNHDNIVAFRNTVVPAIERAINAGEFCQYDSVVPFKLTKTDGTAINDNVQFANGELIGPDDSVHATITPAQFRNMTQPGNWSFFENNHVLTRMLDLASIKKLKFKGTNAVPIVLPLKNKGDAQTREHFFTLANYLRSLSGFVPLVIADLKDIADLGEPSIARIKKSVGKLFLATILCNFVNDTGHVHNGDVADFFRSVVELYQASDSTSDAIADMLMDSSISPRAFRDACEAHISKVTTDYTPSIFVYALSNLANFCKEYLVPFFDKATHTTYEAPVDPVNGDLWQSKTVIRTPLTVPVDYAINFVREQLASAADKDFWFKSASLCVMDPQSFRLPFLPARMEQVEGKFSVLRQAGTGSRTSEASYHSDSVQHLPYVVRVLGAHGPVDEGADGHEFFSNLSGLNALNFVQILEQRKNVGDDGQRASHQLYEALVYRCSSTKRIHRRWSQFWRMSCSVLERVLAHVFSLTTWSGPNLQLLLDNNVLPPFSAMGNAPSRTYKGHTVVLMTSGKNTIYYELRLPDTRSSYDAQHEIIHITQSLWGCPVVMKPENINPIANAFVSGGVANMGWLPCSNPKLFNYRGSPVPADNKYGGMQCYLKGFRDTIANDEYCLSGRYPDVEMDAMRVLESAPMFVYPSEPNEDENPLQMRMAPFYAALYNVPGAPNTGGPESIVSNPEQRGSVNVSNVISYAEKTLRYNTARSEWQPYKNGCTFWEVTEPGCRGIREGKPKPITTLAN